ncbi:MAG: TIGR03936 family radical SAM-associated protein [Sphaerochaetaceae bacterium]|nr:TIGR03936 family radical SAM-associated protein [Sphaerochaetaceae bacterium]
MNKIDVTSLFGNKLLSVTNPARYIGGEYVYGKKQTCTDDSFKVGLCFPDLYEIGMSNNSMRILYDMICQSPNEMICDRVFSVAPDFEDLLRDHDIPLYTLQHGIALSELDVLGFSVGYELAATNILQVLELGKIPLHNDQRTTDHPIVLAGGPAITNPLPFSPFIDFVYIGEAENGLVEILGRIKRMKSEGLNRKEIISNLEKFEMLWYKGKNKAVRAIDDSFSGKEDTKTANFVMPHFKVAQDNGVVEIMRGCPNGCRFCHAGQFYKPFRQKSFSNIYDEVIQQVKDFGYREITLSSLSSGDHPQLESIFTRLNDDFSQYNVSFSLPSLKVSSFSLSILEKMQKVRRSGLTFAIETPLEQWQKAMNKEVPVEQVISIILEAKKRGWKLAKFYFMVGLPFVDPQKEIDAIVTYIKTIKEKTNIGMNLNIGTFIPKAHTPFQWAPQMRKEASREHLIAIKKRLTGEVRGVKVSYHEPYVSYLEGIISRGDERVGDLIEQAYLKGCRLDAWQEHLRQDIWDEVIEKSGLDIDALMYNGYSLDDPLPWDSVSLLVSKAYLKKEWVNAKESVITEKCCSDCRDLCGVCSSEHQVHSLDGKMNESDEVKRIGNLRVTDKKAPVIFIYEKKDKAVYLSHINVMRAFEQTFQRASLDVAFTEGYNPKPKMEFVNPLATGVSGSNEVMCVEIYGSADLDPEQTLDALNTYSPDGFNFKSMQVINTDRRVTLSKYMGGSVYTIKEVDDPEMRESLDNLSKSCSKMANVARLKIKGETVYTVIIKGEKNPLKHLFSKDRDKFDLLSHMHMHREMLFRGEWKEHPDDYTSIAEIWQ